MITAVKAKDKIAKARHPVADFCSAPLAGFYAAVDTVTDTSGRPIRFFITAGQVSDYTGAMALLSGVPKLVVCTAYC